MNKRNWIILGVVVVAAAAIYFAFFFKRQEPTQYFTTAVEKGNIKASVEATGTINAVTTVQVGSQVSGTISNLYADFNTKVKKGQIIAEIDPSIFQGNLLQAQADLENARANLAAARANLVKAQATAQQAQADYVRNQGLAKAGVFSQQQLDLARANAESAAAQVSAQQAQVTQAQAQVSQKQAAVKVSQTNVNYTVIKAPIDGTVIARNVDVGQTVAASLQAPTLFTIAQDLTKMQVYTKTDESDVGRIRPGQQVTFKVDAFPTDTFSGVVSQVRMNATTVQNVVTYDTIIDFTNSDMKLFPGMTAYVSIPVGFARDVIRVPNGALRFKPDLKPEEIRALYQKAGIEMPTRGGKAGAGAAGQSAGQGDGAAGRSGNQAANQAGNQSGDQSANQASGQPGGRGGNLGVGRYAAKGSSPAAGQQGGAGAAAGGRTRPADSTDPGANIAVVWKLMPDKSLVPVQIHTGITDLTYTELVSGDLKEGDLLITGSAGGGKAGAARLGGPGGPGGGPRR